MSNHAAAAVAVAHPLSGTTAQMTVLGPAPRVLVTAAGWKLRPAFMAAVRAALDALPRRADTHSKEPGGTPVVPGLGPAGGQAGAVDSGVGLVHNTLLFDTAEKGVLHAPWRMHPKPIWHLDNRAQEEVSQALLRFLHSQAANSPKAFCHMVGTVRWNGGVKLELQYLAAATPAGTSLVAIQRHVAVTLATWDAVWGEYLHPKWAEQRMRLHGAQEMLEEEAASVSQQEWGTRKQLVVCFGCASIGTRGGWGAKAVLQACRKVVERPNSGKPTDRVPGKVVTVNEFRTSRVSSILNSPQPCEEELDSSKPSRPVGWKPKPGELGKWVDRDCNAALNLQRAGESKWRPLELCRWPHRGRLPAQGKEYPALGFKKLRERAPKALAQQPVAQ
ncbi:hypothetical protein QJQ45_008261 [Haematococcus lacustris]|nr:hypothetical protein QJQ45_008261 [Haematococcus lacustris]